uniref:Uncharacterized protein AlNc14C147G7414 n=1 Tax=Albugo laibachii Nc14 TaxID=890382 RepID=F0WLM5_9STRA|nr:conserved hypothetical protein [Albugo laibachii Nc14]|eukprot:CCA22191.1 conserved hypothetical protein [Albugo laibachii Nc14]
MTSNGVDIAPLDGWMVKINKKPSVFGKPTNRRWFRVSEIQLDQKPALLLSYASTKTSKEPRGSLLLSSVTSIRCSRECIELVAPMRTLRFRGENVMEHRLWEDALLRICKKDENEGNESSERPPEELQPLESAREMESAGDLEVVQDEVESPSSSEEEAQVSEESESQAEKLGSSIKDDLSSNREIAFSDEEEIASPTHKLEIAQEESPKAVRVFEDEACRKADPVDDIEPVVRCVG